MREVGRTRDKRREARREAELHVCVLELAALYGVFLYYGAIATAIRSATV